MSTTNPDRTITPSADELNSEIKGYLTNKPGAEWKQVRASLLRNQKTWKLPERRVAKFVKRQKIGQPITSEDEESVVGSVGPVRRFFSGRMSARDVKSSAASIDTATKSSEAPAKEDIEEEVVETPAPEPTAPVEEEEEPVVEEATKEIVPPEAADDNDGKKDSGLCAGCVIL